MTDESPSGGVATSDIAGGALITGLSTNVMIRQFYLGCLSQASYLVADLDTRSAVAVDPRRDIAELLEVARSEGLTIDYVVQTHFHADFLSGHLELAAATGATIGYGPGAVTEFASHVFDDGERIDLGGVQIELWHTPGHTPESMSVLVRASADGEVEAVLTGDTLFIGDVGRPDLLVAANVPAEELGAALYRSVRRLMTLGDEVVVLPAHGAGSACGKSLSSETVSTIGAQRSQNYAVQPMTEQEFVDIVTEGQPAAPGYFGYDASLNRKLRPIMVEHRLPAVVDLDEFDRLMAIGAVGVDVRPSDDFARAHMTQTLSIPLDGRFAEQVGMFVGPTTPVVLVGDEAAVEEAQLRMARIGFDNVAGALVGPEQILTREPQRSARLSRLTAVEFEQRRAELGATLQFVDVRNPGEVEDAPVPEAINIALPRLIAGLDSLDPALPTVVMCAGGARSAIASSVLSAHGFVDVSDIVGGANALGIMSACQLSEP